MKFNLILKFDIIYSLISINYAIPIKTKINNINSIEYKNEKKKRDIPKPKFDGNFIPPFSQFSWNNNKENNSKQNNDSNEKLPPVQWMNNNNNVENGNKGNEKINNASPPSPPLPWLNNNENKETSE